MPPLETVITAYSDHGKHHIGSGTIADGDTSRREIDPPEYTAVFGES